jgi:hypothetical protein
MHERLNSDELARFMLRAAGHPPAVHAGLKVRGGPSGVLTGTGGVLWGCCASKRTIKPRKQTSKRANIEQTNKQANKQTWKQTSEQTNTQANKQTCKKTNKPTKQVNKQASKRASEQTNKQTHKHALRISQRQRCTEPNPVYARATKPPHATIKQANEQTNTQAIKQANKQVSNKQLTKQASEQTRKQTSKHGNKHANKRTTKQGNKQTSKQAKKQTKKQTNKEASKQTTKQGNKQASKQTSKQANKQTNKQTSKACGADRAAAGAVDQPAPARRLHARPADGRDAPPRRRQHGRLGQGPSAFPPGYIDGYSPNLCSTCTRVYMYMNGRRGAYDTTAGRRRASGRIL